MTDAAIKAAIEVAMAEWMTDPHTLEDEHRAWAIARTAAAVAAFLRALSSDVIEEMPASAYEFRNHLAAAIERAAREDGA